ncbi:MAG: methyltransferase [Bacteroidota bacterium]
MSHHRRPLAARLFDLATGLSTALARLPDKLVPPPFRLIQIGAAFWQSRALYVAARLDLATLIGDGQVEAATLAGRAGAHADSLRRLLRMLAAMGVFEEVRPGTYRNNRLSTALRTDRPNSVRAMILMHNSPEMSRPWFETLEDGIRTGQTPFELAHGMPLYDRMDADPAFDRLFAQAMDQVEALAGDAFTTAFDWRAFDRVIDVGGANGSKSMALLKRHPHLQAIVVDRPQTIAAAREHWTGHDTARTLGRMRFEAGDVFTSVPASTSAKDVYLLSAVLHGFDDHMCAKALRNVAAAAAPNGCPIILLEMLMPDSHADMATASFDMQMLMATKGRERTLAEWEQVFEHGGVRLSEVVHLASFAKMLVLRP